MFYICGSCYRGQVYCGDEGRRRDEAAEGPCAHRVSEAKRLRELEAENRKLKQLLGEAHLDNAALKELLSKNW